MGNLRKSLSYSNIIFNLQVVQIQVVFSIQSPALLSFGEVSRCARERSRVQNRYISTEY